MSNLVELDSEVTRELRDAPRVVFSWVMAGEVGGGDIGDCVGVDADDLQILESSYEETLDLVVNSRAFPSSRQRIAARGPLF